MKISNNMLDYICSSIRVCDMFLDFENNKSYFNEGTYEEYYSALKKHVISFFEKDIINNKYRTQKDSIACIIKLYDLFSKDKDFDIAKDKIFNTLRKYKDMINILVIEKKNPFDLENLDIRACALKNADITIKDIDTFFEKYDYEQIMLKELYSFNEYINSGKVMSKRNFKKYSDLLSNIAIDIPQKYIDLFFETLIKNGYETSYDVVYNVSRSMMSNLARDKNISCLFNVDKLKYDFGIYHDGIITISHQHLNDFVNFPKKNCESFLSTLFHEFTHLVQHANYKLDRQFNYHEIKMLEDRLLVETLNSKYGKKNYKNLSYELDARQMSRVMVYRYFRTLGIKTKNNKFNENRVDSLINNTDRRSVSDIKLIPVDHLFDEFIKSIINVHRGDYLEDIFSVYPILNLMYTKSGKRRSTLELLKMREAIKKNLFDSENIDSDMNKISNINEIIYNKDLSFINLVADYKELMLDESLDLGEEKLKIKKMLYKKIKSVDTKNKFADFTLFINSVFGKKDGNSVEVNDMYKNGIEMTDYFYSIKDNVLKKDNESKRILKK